MAERTSAMVDLVRAEAVAGSLMTVVVESKSQPGSAHRVDVRRAKGGDHAGELYMTCSGPCGKYSWSPRGYVPCRHVREVVEALGIELVEGHFEKLPAVPDGKAKSA